MRRKSEEVDLEDGVEYAIEDLQEVANRVGVGYKNLDTEQLLQKLQSEGIPV